MSACTRIGLVGCVKGKQDVPAPAGDLYTSPLFRGRREYVEHSCDRWFILSALHGLVDPAEILAPYDTTLRTASTAEREAWSARVLEDIRQRLGDVSRLIFEVHAGLSYRDHGLVRDLERGGARVEIPAAGLTLGEQIGLYTSVLGKLSSEGRAASRETTPDAHPHAQTQPHSRPVGRPADLWVAICHHEGRVFRQKRGQPFTYAVRGGAIVPSTTNYRIPRAAFVAARARLPVSGPGQLNDLPGPSYLYAILTDPRIAGMPGERAD